MKYRDLSPPGQDLDSRSFSLLQAADWATIGKQLVAFGVWWCQNYSWRCGGQDLPLGWEVEDVVQEVIARTFGGERKYDPSKGELVPWLKDQVKSIMDARFKSAGHRYERASLEEMQEQGLSEKVEYGTRPAPADPAAALLKAEQAREQVHSLFKAIGGDPELEELLTAIQDGYGPEPRRLAVYLGVPVAEINNRLKRIRRRAIGLKGER